MDLHHKREISVGTLVIVGIALFIAGSMWLRGKSFNTGELTRIQFAEVGALKEASSVRVSGVELGKVQEVEFIEPGKVIVAISLDPRVKPKIDASAKIFTLSLAAGDAAVSFDPGKSAQPLPPGQIIMGRQEVGITDLAATLGARSDSLLMAMQQIITPELGQQFRTTLTALQGTLGAAQQTMRVYGDPNRGPTAELTRTMQQFRALGARLDSTLANPALARAISQSDTLARNLSAMTAQLTATGARMDTLLAGVAAGRGSLGKLASDTMLYNNITRATAQLDSVMAAIKRDPGKIGITVKLF
jgi:phospholipid/cholesterol/gamma-HCH transport system substrate-binding protein